MDSSRAWSIDWSASLLRISCFQLGIFHSHYQAHGFDEALPAPALSGEGLAAFGGEFVVTPAPLIRLLYPQSLHKPPLFKSVQKGIESGDVKAQNSCRSCFNQLAYVIAVT